MHLQDFMSRDLKTIAPRDTVEAAYQLMQQHRIHHLIVMDGHALSGVISERDIVNMNEREREGRLVETLMERHVATAEPGTTVREAANLLRGRTIGCLPVLEDDKPVGIVTITDILDLLGQGIERITPDTPKRPVTRENPGRKPPSFNPQL